MSAGARKRANLQAGAYPDEVLRALADEDESHVDIRKCRFLECPVCGNLILHTCGHEMERWARRQQLRRRHDG